MSQQKLPYRVVDAFTDRPFAGNPAAVLVLDHLIPDEAMQAIAGEMNLSETAFVYPPGNTGIRRIRWFTPTTEVQLCGHATLASARSLQADGEPFPLVLDSLSGPLEVHQEEDGRLRLDFPSDPPSEAPPPTGLAEALGLALESDLEQFAGRVVGHAPRYFRGKNLWLVLLHSQEAVAVLHPDMTALRDVELGKESLGVTVTAPGPNHPEGSTEPSGPDFVSRFFAPWVGVDEDPVTGVAHTVLTPFWTARLGKDPLEARQISRRGGDLTVRQAGDRVHLVGSAVVVSEGEILLPEN